MLALVEFRGGYVAVFRQQPLERGKDRAIVSFAVVGVGALAVVILAMLLHSGPRRSGTDRTPDGGFALRVTHSGKRVNAIFSGTLTTTTGKFVDAQGIGDQGNDIVAVGPSGRTILFRFVDFGQVDGLDFGTHCTVAFKVNIHISGSLAPVSALHLGAQEVIGMAAMGTVTGGMALGPASQPWQQGR